MRRKIFWIPVFLLFLAGAAFTGYQIYSITSEYRAGEKVYENVNQYISLPPVETVQPVQTQPRQAAEATEGTQPEPEETKTLTQPTEEPLIFPEVDFAALKQINPDVTGWIYIEDTNISYPVVQGSDNRYYVSTLIDGTYNGAGTIFMDYRNQPDLSDIHTIFYGHNMKNGTMFHDIVNYRDQEYYDAHPMGLVMTPEGNYRFEIMASYVASMADPAWQLEFVAQEDALLWLQDAMDRSGFVSRVQPEEGDKILTLSTCSYEFDEARTVLVGVLRAA